MITKLFYQTTLKGFKIDCPTCRAAVPPGIIHECGVPDKPKSAKKAAKK